MVHSGRWVSCTSNRHAAITSAMRRIGVFAMSKRYEIVRDLLPLPGGGFVEALRMAIVEFTSLGPRQFDLAGYPYDSELEALESDWDALGKDFRQAAVKLKAIHGEKTVERVEPSTITRKS